MGWDVDGGSARQIELMLQQVLIGQEQLVRAEFIQRFLIGSTFTLLSRCLFSSATLYDITKILVGSSPNEQVDFEELRDLAILQSDNAGNAACLALAAMVNLFSPLIK